MPIRDWTRVNPGTFHHFHTAWIAEISKALNRGLLPREYYALAEQQAGDIGPDVLTLHRGNGSNGSEPRETGGTALATAPPQVRFTAQIEADFYAAKRRTLAIRHVSDDRIVALVEIVSPGSSRYKLQRFVHKAVSALELGIHLLVINLFPPGSFDAQGIHGAIWSELGDSSFQLPPDKPLTLVAYSSDSIQKAFIEPVAAGDTLLPMPLYLDPPAYVPIPLDETYRLAFAAVPDHLQQMLKG
jgi:hypothetical protein